MLALYISSPNQPQLYVGVALRGTFQCPPGLSSGP